MIAENERNLGGRTTYFKSQRERERERRIKSEEDRGKGGKKRQNVHFK